MPVEGFSIRGPSETANTPRTIEDVALELAQTYQEIVNRAGTLLVDKTILTPVNGPPNISRYRQDTVLIVDFSDS